jgi:hypothetical protein
MPVAVLGTEADSCVPPRETVRMVEKFAGKFGHSLLPKFCYSDTKSWVSVHYPRARIPLRGEAGVTPDRARKRLGCRAV